MVSKHDGKVQNLKFSGPFADVRKNDTTDPRSSIMFEYTEILFSD